MKKKKNIVQSQTLDFEQILDGKDQLQYSLKLYITGITPQSSKAIDNIHKICEKHLKDRYKLEIIDLYKNPELASGAQIIAAPTLLKQLPLPLRRIIGDMSNKEKVLIGLDLKQIEKYV